jgi:hypothetical protein
VKPNTSPSTHKEKTIMAAPSSIRTTLLNLITKNPGIKRSDLIDQALASCPGETRKRAIKTLGNMEHAAKLIEKTGKLDLCAYTLKSGTKGNKKTAPAAIAKKPAKKSKPRATVDFVKKPHPVPAVPIVAELKYGFNLGGSFTLRKNGRDILLSPDEAMDLMQYGAQQVAMINQIQGESA